MAEYKRNIAVEKLIKQISNTDSRVSIIGTIVSIDKDSLLVDIEDTTGVLTVILPNNEFLNNLEIGKLIRVIGIVLPFDEGFELRAEIIQDFSSLSPELFNLYKSLLDSTNN